MRADRLCSGRPATRRQFLAAGGTAVLSAVAGCSVIGEFVGEILLKEVNIVNETDQQISGSIEIIGPNDNTVLNKAFDLVPSGSSEADDDDKNSAAIYDDVWSGAGAYEVSVELTNTDINGTTAASETISIHDTEAEMLGVTLGPEVGDEAILFRVGEDPADISDPADVSADGG